MRDGTPSIELETVPSVGIADETNPKGPFGGPRVRSPLNPCWPKKNVPAVECDITWGLAGRSRRLRVVCHVFQAYLREACG